MAPIFSKTGKKIGTALTLQDSIQQNRKSDDQAGRTGRLAAMGEMAVQIAHEIRNPLGSIGLFASVLEKDLEGFEELKAIAGHISSGVNSINTIISNLLLFIQPNQKAKMQALDVHEPLKDSLFFADHIFEANDAITVITEFGSTPMVIDGDSELLKQIALNLILNAIQAMPDGGVLTISTRKIESKGREFAEIRFADTGCGISEADQAKIFDPFFTTKTRGTGLGLTIVHNITKIHGGDIDIRSTEAAGTECIITLPLAIQDNTHETK
jgi:signal transduction histidine kinase